MWGPSRAQQPKIGMSRGWKYHMLFAMWPGSPDRVRCPAGFDLVGFAHVKPLAALRMTEVKGFGAGGCRVSTLSSTESLLSVTLLFQR